MELSFLQVSLLNYTYQDFVTSHLSFMEEQLALKILLLYPF